MSNDSTEFTPFYNVQCCHKQVVFFRFDRENKYDNSPNVFLCLNVFPISLTGITKLNNNETEMRY